MNEYEKKYVTHDLDLALIVHGLKMVSHYLIGRRFCLITYHCDLKYLFNQTSLNARQVMWMALINEFDFETKHIKGKKKKVVDALSQSVYAIHLT
jgi:hypothetical protein